MWRLKLITTYYCVFKTKRTHLVKKVLEVGQIFFPWYIFFLIYFILRNRILNFGISKGNKLNAQLVLNLNYNYIAIPNIYASLHLRALGMRLLLFSICFGVKYFHFTVFGNILEITQVLVFLHCKKKKKTSLRNNVNSKFSTT